MVVFSDIKRCQHPHFTQLFQKAAKKEEEVQCGSALRFSCREEGSLGFCNFENNPGIKLRFYRSTPESLTASRCRHKISADTAEHGQHLAKYLEIWQTCPASAARRGVAWPTAGRGGAGCASGAASRGSRSATGRRSAREGEGRGRGWGPDSSSRRRGQL